MPEFEPELLQPQPGVLPMSYTHPVAVNGAKEKKWRGGSGEKKMTLIRTISNKILHRNLNKLLLL